MKRLVILIPVLLAAACGGTSSGTAGGTTNTADCAALRGATNQKLEALGVQLATGDAQYVVDNTIELVDAKRAEYADGCVTKAGFSKFLRENANSVQSYGCPDCVAVFDREARSIDG